MSRSGPAAALLLAGSLALSACGAGASPASGGGPPESVRIGPYTQVFATALPTNAAQAKVMEGFREAQVLWIRSDSAMHLVAPVTSYVTGQARTDLTGAVTAGRTNDLVPAGTDRFFMTRVTAIADRSATVATCDDGSKYREENPGTGRINPAYTAPADQAYLFETWHMAQLSGHWAIASFSLITLPDRRAQPCQPTKR